jgi:hypothetical protein
MLLSAYFKYSVDCRTQSVTSFPDVTIIIGGSTFVLSAFQYLWIVIHEREYLCYTIFRGLDFQDELGRPIWILGNYFLSRFYSIYDAQHHRIGLAPSISYNYSSDFASCLFSNGVTMFFLKFRAGQSVLVLLFALMRRLE